jgi:hypothetical protein
MVCEVSDQIFSRALSSSLLGRVKALIGEGHRIFPNNGKSFLGDFGSAGACFCMFFWHLRLLGLKCQ